MNSYYIPIHIISIVDPYKTNGKYIWIHFPTENMTRGNHTTESHKRLYNTFHHALNILVHIPDIENLGNLRYSYKQKNLSIIRIDHEMNIWYH